MCKKCNIFQIFRGLRVFKRNKKPFELKLLAVLDYIFGSSYRKISKKLSIIFEPTLNPQFSIVLEYLLYGIVLEWYSSRTKEKRHNSSK